MENIWIDKLWVLFIGIGAWIVQRLTAQLDSLSKEKADAITTREETSNNYKLIHEVDRRVDKISHLGVNRSEHQQAVYTLHERINELEKTKASRVQAIRVLKDSDKKDGGNN